MLMFALAGVTGTLLAAGCGSTDTGQPGAGAGTTEATTTSSAPATTPSVTPSVPMPTVSLPLPPPPTPTGGDPVYVPPALLDQIRADAAQRSGVSPAQVQVVSSNAQTWNDGSLGCPKPGEFYTQALVDGYQVIVEAGGRTYDYRTSQTGIRLCEK